MSNYKEQLQNNNNELSAILETVEELPKSNTMVVYNDSDYGINVQGVHIRPNEFQEVPVPSVTNMGSDDDPMFSYTLCCSALIASSGEYSITSTWYNGYMDFTDAYIMYITDMQFEASSELGFTTYPYGAIEISTIHIDVQRFGDIGGGEQSANTYEIFNNLPYSTFFINGHNIPYELTDYNVYISPETNVVNGMLMYDDYNAIRSLRFGIVNMSTNETFEPERQLIDEESGLIYFIMSVYGEPGTQLMITGEISNDQT